MSSVGDEAKAKLLVVATALQASPVFEDVETVRTVIAAALLIEEVDRWGVAKDALGNFEAFIPPTDIIPPTKSE